MWSTTAPAPFTTQIPTHAAYDLLWNIGPVTASMPYIATAAENQTKSGS
ncbi:hypothetical protein PY479_03115 [Shewanella sp. A32]|nr:hypothetical protein [Shewanella sp. A32]MDF0533268.1 hypothetical protein [Shewanella sp. A32]